MKSEAGYCFGGSASRGDKGRFSQKEAHCSTVLDWVPLTIFLPEVHHRLECGGIDSSFIHKAKGSCTWDREAPRGIADNSLQNPLVLEQPSAWQR